MAIDLSSQRQFNNNLVGRSTQIFDYDPYLDERGDFRKTEDINVVIRSIRTLLMTPLGHYPFDPTFGSELYKQVFEPFDEETIKKIDFEIRNRIEMYEDRCIIDDVNYAKTTDGKTLIVNVLLDRNGVKGKLDLYLSPNQTMFGLEDALTDTDY